MDVFQTNVTGTRKRKKEKGDKVLFKLTDIVESCLLDINASFLQYSTIYTIDTNYKKIKDKLYSVTAVAQLIKTEDDNFECLITPLELVWNNTYPEKMENWAWAVVIEKIRKDDKCYALGEKIRIVVDSDLGNIEKYNDKELLIYGNYYLPEETCWRRFMTLRNRRTRLTRS